MITYGLCSQVGGGADSSRGNRDGNSPRGGVGLGSLNRESLGHGRSAGESQGRGGNAPGGSRSQEACYIIISKVC